MLIFKNVRLSLLAVIVYLVMVMGLGKPEIISWPRWLFVLLVLPPLWEAALLLVSCTRDLWSGNDDDGPDLSLTVRPLIGWMSERVRRLLPTTDKPPQRAADQNDEQ